MKKYGLGMLFLVLGANLMAGPFQEKDIPVDVEREITRYFANSSSESRRQDISDAKDAYIRLQNKAYDSGIPKEDLEIIIVRLHQIYGTNFQKQAGEFEKEAAQYHDMVRRVEEKVREEQGKKEEENKNAKAEIEALLKEDVLKKEVSTFLLKRANEKYPDQPLAQKYFLEGAMELEKIKK